MKRHIRILAACAAAFVFVEPASAACSVKSLAGRWMFATGIGGQSALPNFGDISAIGVFSVDRAGNLTGKFDANILNGQPMIDVKFDGAITLNADCRGTLTFKTEKGDARTDSIVMISAREIAGMRRDPQFVWTYQMRRL
jgi:hypothetical protein